MGIKEGFLRHEKKIIVFLFSLVLILIAAIASLWWPVITGQPSSKPGDFIPRE